MHKPRSQSSYLFRYGNVVISWRSIKQIIAATSNHVKVIVIHEASQKYVWLMSIVHCIRDNCVLSSVREIQTHLYEDNIAYIVQ